MRRRLDLAAALVHNPQILFLDEPTTGLDPVSRAAVWEEVRRLNIELGMTIFLTTQYLEEADVLADRVGIIDAGRLVAEGTPADLKRSVGTDVIIARLDRDASTVCDAVEQVPGVISVEARGTELIVSTADGSATVSPVAVALGSCDVTVRDLTLRTTIARRCLPRAHRQSIRTRRVPGGRVMTVSAATLRNQAAAVEPRAAGFLSDTATIAGRALRAIPRDVETVIPPIFIALFFFLVNIGTLSDLTEGRSKDSTSPRSSCRRRSCSASPGCHVRRHSCSTCRTATSTACCSLPSDGWRSCSVIWSPTSPSPAR